MHKLLIYLLVHWNICWRIIWNTNENERKENWNGTRNKIIFVIQIDYLIWMQKNKKKTTTEEKKSETKKCSCLFYSLLFCLLRNVSMRTFYISNGKIPWNEFELISAFLCKWLFIRNISITKRNTIPYIINMEHRTYYILNSSLTSSYMSHLVGFYFWFAIRIY